MKGSGGSDGGGGVENARERLAGAGRRKSTWAEG